MISTLLQPRVLALWFVLVMLTLPSAATAEEGGFITVALRTNILVASSTDSEVSCESGSGAGDACVVLPDERDGDDLSPVSLALEVLVFQIVGVSLDWEPLTEIKFESVDSGIPQRDYEIGQVWRINALLEYPLCMDDGDCWLYFPVRAFGGVSLFVPGYERTDGAADFCEEALALGRSCTVDDGVAAGWNAGLGAGAALDFGVFGVRADVILRWEKFDWWISERERSGGVVTKRSEALDRFQTQVGIVLFTSFGG